MFAAQKEDFGSMKIKKKAGKPAKPMTKAQEKKLLKKAVNKAFSLWGEIGRIQTGDTCELCGARRGDLKDNGKPTILNGHHLRIRDDHSLRFNPKNNSTLCQWCHKFSREGAHRGTILFNEWLRKNRPLDYDYLLKNSNKEPIESLEDVLLAVSQLTHWKLWLMGFREGILHTGLDGLGVRMEGTEDSGDIYGNHCG